MPISSKFRFSWVPFIATVLLVALGITLGNWQTRRAVEKEGIEAALQAQAGQAAINLSSLALAPVMPNDEALLFRKVQARGHFVPEWPLYLDNRPYERRAGLHLMMPFRIAGSNMTVLVARGWIPRDPADRARLPVTPTPANDIDITGSIRRHPARVYQFGDAAQLKPGAIVQNINLEELSVASGLSLLPFIIEQSDQAPSAGQLGKAAEIDGQNDGLVRDWPLPSHGADKHRGYAFQWYGLALAAFLFFIVTGFRRGTKL